MQIYYQLCTNIFHLLSIKCLTFTCFLLYLHFTKVKHTVDTSILPLPIWKTIFSSRSKSIL